MLLHKLKLINFFKISLFSFGVYCTRMVLQRDHDSANAVFLSSIICFGSLPISVQFVWIRSLAQWYNLVFEHDLVRFHRFVRIRAELRRAKCDLCRLQIYQASYDI